MTPFFFYTFFVEIKSFSLLDRRKGAQKMNIYTNTNIGKLRKGLECLVIDLETGEEILVPSMAAVRHIVNVNSNKIRYLLSLATPSNPCVINGYMVIRKEDQTP